MNDPTVDYVVAPMGANGHRWLARSAPGARPQIAVTGLTEAEARAQFEDAWRAWDDLMAENDELHEENENLREELAVSELPIPREGMQRVAASYVKKMWGDHKHA